MNMSESVRPSSSQTAMSIAFKKARRKFPKNFGLTFNHRERMESSESEAGTPSCKNGQEAKLISFDHVNDRIGQKSLAECIESELVDSLKEVKLTEEPEIIREHCHGQADNSIGIHLKLDCPILDEGEKCESAHLEKRELAYDDDYESELPAEADPSSYRYHETCRGIGLIWSGQSDHCDDEHYGSEMDETPSRKSTEETRARRKWQSHRRKKSSHCHSDCTRHEDERLECPASCPCHQHCARCQCYHRYCSCCRVHCLCCTRCCTRCCTIWQERAVIAREACSTWRRRHSKKKRCSACNGKRRSSSPSIPCSRDSGIFTQTRYGDYEDDEEDASATLMHKDSLSILQEKYAKRNGRRVDDEERPKGRNTCKRVPSRYSYY